MLMLTPSRLQFVRPTRSLRLSPVIPLKDGLLIVADLEEARIDGLQSGTRSSSSVNGSDGLTLTISTSRKCIEYWDTPATLFFLDPPYYNVSSGGFYQFTLRDHDELRLALGKVQGKWMLTYDDAEQIREMYKGYEIRPVTSSLSSQKVDRGTKRLVLRQLLITNFVLGDNDRNEDLI